MQALCAELGEPQQSWRSLHVVGTNGKSSVTVMCAALLERQGIRSGACISPHTSRWRERTRVAGAELGQEAFERATAEVAAAIDAVEPSFTDGARITQFEAAIAVSFVAFRNEGVEVAVIEAGLGGRLDATNVIPSLATALTSVGLDHTDWLGETVEEIAAEKLAVLRPETTLVLGALPPAIEAIAREHAAGLDAEVIDAPPASDELVPTSFGPYLRRNAGVALELATLAAGARPDEDAARAAFAEAQLSGRFELVAGDPPLIFDAAHNRDGAAALAEALRPLAAASPAVVCVSVLADKDAAGIAAELAPLADAVVCTAADPGPAMGRPGAVALEPERLASAFTAAGAACEVEPDPLVACRRAIELAGDRSGFAVFAGSHYLLRHAWTVKQDQSSSR